MMVVGLTGGIGSGKTTVAVMFEKLGVPIYIADVEAKKLMNEEEDVKHKVIELLGPEAYVEGELNRSYIASKVFFDKELLVRLNNIVHPAVGDHFDRWKEKQKAPYVIKEAAVLFENDAYKLCDKIITVMAPVEVRISRVLERDDTTRDAIEARISNQWTDEEKTALSDYVIHNVLLEDTQKQVAKIHAELLDLVV
ncbi:dephospho-CoA kinase [Sungkyunkwania multivorans]|uniref:Dephospho-CoA kinase n=1 Tax=Sungkyunkwania multivorans TaxID=1173618 RepID=A0ABW3CYH7_9FLAO